MPQPRKPDRPMVPPAPVKIERGIESDGPVTYPRELVDQMIADALAKYTFKSDAAAQAAFERGQGYVAVDDHKRPHWLGPPGETPEIELDGRFTIDELLAIIYFHPHFHQP